MDFCVTVSQVKRLQKAIYLKLHSLIAIMLPLQRNIFSVHAVIFKSTGPDCGSLCGTDPNL